MGAATRYLGHVDITPPLDQAEYDHLRTVLGGETRFVTDDGLEPWCPWEPCPHGCCLRWDGSDSHGVAGDGLQLLIDRCLSPGTPGGLDDARLEGLTVAHDTNGVIVGQEGDSRALLLMRVCHGRVGVEVLHPGDPRSLREVVDAGGRLPWLSPEPSPSERCRRENAATLAKPRAAATREGG